MEILLRIEYPKVLYSEDDLACSPVVLYELAVAGGRFSLLLFLVAEHVGTETSL